METQRHEDSKILIKNSGSVAPLLSYLKLTHLRLGLLINSNVPLIKRGIKRVIR